VHLRGVEKEMTDNELADLLEEVNEETGRCSVRIFDHAKVLIRKLEEKRVWQYLTEDEIKEIIGGYGDEGGIGGYTRTLIDKIEAKIKEKNVLSS
jgi:predicted house-cleaning NTP pyrophosphatase (Maf/HAM1 superfamily)